MNERRDFLYLLTGLALGLGLGLVISWVLAPVQFVDTSPASLRVDFKDEYRYMIAAAYSATGNLPRAQARLGWLGDANPLQALSDEAQRMLNGHSSPQTVQVLGDFSEALQTEKTTAAAQTPVPTETIIATPNQVEAASLTPQDGMTATPTDAATALATTLETATPPAADDTATPIPSPIPTLAPKPKPSATPSPGPAFELAQQASQCDPAQPGLLRVYLFDAAGKPVAGVELILTWFGGEEHFFSGLKPEISPGYADYTLNEAVVEYDLSFATAGTRVTGLRAPTCTDQSGKSYPGGIRLDFKQP